MTGPQRPAALSPQPPDGDRRQPWRTEWLRDERARLDRIVERLLDSETLDEPGSCAAAGVARPAVPVAPAAASPAPPAPVAGPTRARAR